MPLEDSSKNLHYETLDQRCHFGSGKFKEATRYDSMIEHIFAKVWMDLLQYMFAIARKEERHQTSFIEFTEMFAQEPHISAENCGIRQEAPSELEINSQHL